jgi:hypothetical protein
MYETYYCESFIHIFIIISAFSIVHTTLSFILKCEYWEAIPIQPDCRINSVIHHDILELIFMFEIWFTTRSDLKNVVDINNEFLNVAVHVILILFSITENMNSNDWFGL